jgi:hypothetical protein
LNQDLEAGMDIDHDGQSQPEADACKGLLELLSQHAAQVILAAGPTARTVVHDHP